MSTMRINELFENKQIRELRMAIMSEQDIILFGMGMLGKLVMRYFKIRHRTVALIIDNDSAKWGGKNKNIRIVSPEEGIKKFPKGIYVIANLKHGKEMGQQLLELGIPEENIIICEDQKLLRLETESYLDMQSENKYFIFNLPYEKCIVNIIKRIIAYIHGCWYKVIMNAWHPQNQSIKKYDVCLCAIFKNEAPYLREWIEYHKLIGVQHFYLYNNFSEDNYIEILDPYVVNGDVTLFDWPYQHRQMDAYRDCIEKFNKESKWIGFIDLDEFVVPIDDINIYDFLKKFEKNRGSVLIYWKMFGAAGKLDRDIEGLVTEDFTVCRRKHTNTGKCFFNTNYELLKDDKKIAYYITLCGHNIKGEFIRR